MALPSSGTISISQINAEFSRGTNLNAYRGTTWWTTSGTSGTFPSGAISMTDFYGKSNFVAPTATGGTIYDDAGSGYRYHIFKVDGTFTLTSMGTAATLDTLLVGGGGGARGDTGSGGGGGGLVMASGRPSAGSWGVTIGNGGTGYLGTGSNSTAMGMTAVGGGGGTNVGSGQAGGSGAGASASGSGGAATQPGTAQSPISGLSVTQNLGNAGGSGIGGGSYYPGAGGGGAGGAGQGSNNSGTGAGGAAYSPGWSLPASQVNASASVLSFAGGGGGGTNFGTTNQGGTNAGRGGSSGAAGTSGLANFGGGGGGSGGSNGTTTSGGSGVFIVRYKYLP